MARLSANHCYHSSVSQIEQVIIVIPATFAPANHNLVFFLLLALVLGNSVQKLLELFLGHLLTDLAGLRQHHEPVFDVNRTRFLDHADTAEAIGSGRVEDLTHDGGTAVS